MSTHCKKLIEYLEDQIDNHGLKAISGTDFSKHPVRRVLAAKQFEHRIYTAMPKGGKGKFVSKAQIAKDLLGMLTAKSILIIGECMVCSKFLLEGQDENHICPPDKIQEHKESQEAWKIIQKCLYK